MMLPRHTGGFSSETVPPDSLRMAAGAGSEKVLSD